MLQKRTLVIGDIHAGLKALIQVLEKVKVTTADTLIFLGDYVDGWSQAVETVNFILRLQTIYDCVFLRGNHDELCYEWLIDGQANPLWLQHGGMATMASYEKTDRETIKRHIAFYQSLVNYYLDEENRLFLHAGFTNLKGVEHEYFKQTYYWDRTLWELAVSLHPDMDPRDPFYPQRLSHYKEIFIGHTPVTRMGKRTPQHVANVWNVDTGAAFKGPLSILDADTKTFWQSDPVYTFYPGENGRN
jgi:serine/threonine protein phosphatase 1